MSRVIYTDTPSTADQETLRGLHQVRLVNEAEEGTGVNALAEGVYGFTYSPVLANAPLFRERRYRSFETHKVAGGDVFIVGFTTPDMMRMLSSALNDVSIVIQPEPEQEATVLVKIPYSRIRHHRQYAAPNQHGFSVTVGPAA